MKIGLIKRSFRLNGGRERQISYLIEGLLEQGHAVHLISEQLPPAERLEGLTYHTMPALPMPRACRALGFALMVHSALRRTELPLVQSFERTLGQHIYRAGEGVHREWLWRKRRSLSTLGRASSYLSLFDRVTLALERRALCDTPMIVTIAERGQHDIKHHYGVPPGRMQTIYNGIDGDRFNVEVRRRFRETQRAVWGVSSAEVVLLSVGSGFHRKGLDRTIEALAQLQRRGVSHVRLVVVGKGHVRSYRRQACRAGVADLVRFDGQRDDVEHCYAGADLFVLPTRYEPFGNACLEAMACGLPVLTTAASGAAELLRDGLNGRVLEDTASAETLADTLQGLLPAEPRLAMGEAAQQTAKEYPLCRMLMHTLQVYDTVANQAVAV